jgi:hypothetical protein
MSLFESASLVVTPNGAKASKLYAIKPTSGAGDLSVTRATTATRVNSAGLIESVAVNVPRLDYTNGSCPSILVEPQRTNVLLRSQEFDNVAWLTFRSSVSSNATISPDGTTNAEKLIQQSGVNDAGGIYQLLTISNSTVYTYSFFAKADGFNFCFLRLSNSPSDFYAWFNLSTGTVGSTSGGTTSSSIVSYGNGWYRCSMTFTSVGITAIPHIYIGNSNGSDQTPGANGVKGIFAYGAQIEAGSCATSYIPTTSASVTRNADVISKTGISSLIGQTEGTIFVDFIANGKYATSGSEASNLIATLSDGTSSNWISLNLYLGEIDSTIVTSGSTQFFYNAPSQLPYGRNKLAISYKQNDIALYLNGNLIASDSSANIPAMSKLNLGSFLDNQYQHNNGINSLMLWKTRLGNEKLAELTTI